MSVMFPIQTSFLGGRISNSVQGNVQTDIYDKSVNEMVNFIPTPQGSARFRSGMVNAGNPWNNTLVEATPRLFAFNTSFGNFCIEVGETWIGLWKRNGDVIESVDANTSLNLLTDPSFQDPDNTGWQVEGSIWDVPAFTKITNNGAAGIFRFNRVGPASWQNLDPGVSFGADISFWYQSTFLLTFAEGGPFHPIPFISDGNGNLLGRRDPLNRVCYPCMEIFGADGGLSSPGTAPDNVNYTFSLMLKHTIRIEDGGKDFEFSFKNWYEGCIAYDPGPNSPEIYLDGKSLVAGIPVVAKLQPTHFFRVRVGTTYNANDILQEDFPCVTGQEEFYEFTTAIMPALAAGDIYIAITLLGEHGEYDIGGNIVSRSQWRSWTYEPELRAVTGLGPSVTRYPSPWNKTQIDEMMHDVEPSEALMIFTHQDVETHYLEFDGTAWTFDAISTNGSWTPPGPGWLPGTYPSACEFDGGRLYLAGGRDNGSAISGSAVSDFFNFTVPGVPAPEDALYWETRFKGKVVWLKANRKMIIGNTSNEVTLDSSDGPVTFANFDFNYNTGWGSWPVQPINIDNRTLFIQKGGKAIRVMSDKGDQQYGYLVEDLSILSTDVLGAGINEMAWGAVPNYQLIFKAGDALAACTYLPEQDVKAFYNFEMPINTNNQNQIHSVAAVDDVNGTVFWVLVTRNNNVRYIEFYSEAHYGDRFLDMSRQGTLTAEDRFYTPVSSGINYGEDPITFVIADEDGKTYVEYDISPQFDLLAPFARHYVFSRAYTGTCTYGLRYVGRIQTLKPEGSNPSGTAQVDKRRFSEAILRITKSAMPMVNGQSMNLNQQLDDDSAPIVDPNAILTGDYPIPMSGYTDGVLNITHEKPLPCEITAAYGTMRSSRR